jgi:hypothetical protein
MAMTNEPTFYIVITDARESCTKKEVPVSQPGNDVCILFLLTPNVEDIDQGKSMAAVYHETKARMRASAPWVRVAPMSISNISVLLTRDQIAKSNGSSR